MNAITRGIRNAYRNTVRTISVVFILGLSIGLSLIMLIAHQAVSNKIESVKSSEGNTVTISPAGVRGFQGGGNPLTAADANKVINLAHVTAYTESLDDRLTSTNTSLKSSITAGSLGQRFAGNSGESFSGGGGQGGGFGGGFSGGSSGSGNSSGTVNFTPPVTVLGTDNPSNLSASDDQGGGTFKLTAGKVFNGTSNSDVAIVGSALASKNNLKVGSTFTAYSKTITVIGIYDAGNSFSNSELLMPLATVQSLSSQTGDLSQIVLTTDSINNVSSVASAASKDLGSSADVTNSKTTAETTIQPLQNIQSISLYSLIGAVIAGSIIILLVMIMIVRERRREIGVIKAIGASNLKIVSQFMVEAVTLTIMASVIGIILGVLGGNPITKLLVNNSTSSSTSSPSSGGIRVGGGAGGFPGSGATFRGGGHGLGGSLKDNLSNIHAVVGVSIIAYGIGAAILIAVAGSAMASFFIAKIRPAEVLRSE